MKKILLDIVYFQDRGEKDFDRDADPTRYLFDSQAEADAFLYGLNEAFSQLYDDEEVVGYGQTNLDGEIVSVSILGGDEKD